MATRNRQAQWSMALDSRTKRASWIVVAICALLGSGCAGAAARPGTIGTMQDILNLQEDIDEQQGIMAGDGACQDRCRAVASICDSAGRICEVASDLAEIEALQSCRRAESICHEAQVRVDEGCACP